MIRFIINAVDTIRHAAAGYIHLTADDGLHCCSLGGLVEINTAVHDTVVGDGNGTLAQLLHPIHHAADAAGTVQKAVFRMNM